MAKKSFLGRFQRDDEIASDASSMEERSPEKAEVVAPKKRERLTIQPGQIALFAFAAVLFFGTLFALLGIFVLRPSAASVNAAEPAAVPDYAVKSAREAYPAAVELIRIQDPGAVLASAVALWTPGTPAINLQSGRSGWTFHFYLPATAEMATVVVDREGIARVETRSTWAEEPQLLDDTRWQLDSPPVMSLYLDRCEKELAGVDDAAVEARLTTALSAGQILWQVSFTSEADPTAACSITVDALTGLVR